MLYAGATEAVAMTVVEISPRAPDLRPLSSCASCVSADCSAVAMSHLPGVGPARPGPVLPGKWSAGPAGPDDGIRALRRDDGISTDAATVLARITLAGNDIRSNS